MQATVDIPALKQALAVVKPAVRNNDEVLTAARVEAFGSMLAVAATDLELTIRTTLPAQVAQAGATAVHHKTLLSLLHGAGSIDLAARNGRLHALNGTATLLPTLEDGRYPRLVDDGEFTRAHQVPVAELRRILPAAASDSTRPSFNGVAFNGTTLTATDTYRLHTVDVPGLDLPTMVVPARGLDAMLRRAGDARSVTMLVSDRAVQFRVAGSPASWTVRLIAEAFPDVTHLWPASPPNRLRLETEPTMAILDAAVKEAPNQHEPVTLELGDRQVAVTMNRAVDESPWAASVPAFYVGEPMTVRFNPRFLRDCVTTTNSRWVTVDLEHGLKPAVIRGDDDNDDTFRALLMPVRG